MDTTKQFPRIEYFAPFDLSGFKSTKHDNSKRKATCPDCWGSGWKTQFVEPCKKCKGSGQV